MHVNKKLSNVTVALCTKWIPEMEQLPLKITTKTIAFSGKSLHHPESREVVLTVSIRFMCLYLMECCKIIIFVKNHFQG